MSQKESAFINRQQQTILSRHLKRIDADFVSIILVTGKVCVYRLENGWTETGIEGPLYLYSRGTFPLHRLLVFNRKSLQDFKMDVLESFSCELKERLVVFGSEGLEAVFGFWFEDEEDGNTLFRVLEGIRTR